MLLCICAYAYTCMHVIEYVIMYVYVCNYVRVCIPINVRM
jgi:hypothetical protein